MECDVAREFLLENSFKPQQGAYVEHESQSKQLHAGRYGSTARIALGAWKITERIECLAYVE